MCKFALSVYSCGHETTSVPLPGLCSISIAGKTYCAKNPWPDTQRRRNEIYYRTATCPACTTKSVNNGLLFHELQAVLDEATTRAHRIDYRYQACGTRFHNVHLWPRMHKIRTEYDFWVDVFTAFQSNRTDDILKHVNQRLTDPCQEVDVFTEKASTSLRLRDYEMATEELGQALYHLHTAERVMLDWESKVQELQRYAESPAEDPLEVNFISVASAREFFYRWRSTLPDGKLWGEFDGVVPPETATPVEIVPANRDYLRRTQSGSGQEIFNWVEPPRTAAQAAQAARDNRVVIREPNPRFMARRES